MQLTGGGDRFFDTNRGKLEFSVFLTEKKFIYALRAQLWGLATLNTCLRLAFIKSINYVLFAIILSVLFPRARDVALSLSLFLSWHGHRVDNWDKTSKTTTATTNM